MGNFIKRHGLFIFTAVVVSSLFLWAWTYPARHEKALDRKALKSAAFVEESHEDEKVRLNWVDKRMERELQSESIPENPFSPEFREWRENLAKEVLKDGKRSLWVLKTELAEWEGEIKKTTTRDEDGNLVVPEIVILDAQAIIELREMMER